MADTNKEAPKVHQVSPPAAKQESSIQLAIKALKAAEKDVVKSGHRPPFEAGHCEACDLIVEARELARKVAAV